MTQPLVDVQDLSVSFSTDDGNLNILDQISFHINSGETLGIVGESGCGKSVTALSIMGLLPKPSGNINHGTIQFDGNDLDNAMRRQLRGNKIAMIFQEPMTALNPVHRVGQQLAEVFDIHKPSLSSAERTDACIQLLEKVGIPSPEKRISEYPHQLSGGMRQRVMIAMALVCEPQLLIADEPTTALDVTIQAQILELLVELQTQNGMAIMFITHDLGVVSQLCDRVAVMYAGNIVETGKTQKIIETPKHPYTQGLLQSIPHLGQQNKTPLQTIPGSVPSASNMPAGCRFNNRCKYANELCRSQKPLPEKIGSQDHELSCHHWQENCHD